LGLQELVFYPGRSRQASELRWSRTFSTTNCLALPWLASATGSPASASIVYLAHETCEVRVVWIYFIIYVWLELECFICESRVPLTCDSVVMTSSCFSSSRLYHHFSFNISWDQTVIPLRDNPEVDGSFSETSLRPMTQQPSPREPLQADGPPSRLKFCMAVSTSVVTLSRAGQERYQSNVFATCLTCKPKNPRRTANEALRRGVTLTPFLLPGTVSDPPTTAREDQEARLCSQAVLYAVAFANTQCVPVVPHRHTHHPPSPFTHINPLSDHINVTPWTTLIVGTGLLST
jgi:hypothetical protein